MKARLTCSLFCAALAAPSIAQSDEWLVSGFDNFIGSGNGGLWLVDAGRTTATLMSGQTPNMRGANCVAADEVGLAYYGTINSGSVSIPNPGEIFQVVIAGGAIAAEFPQTSGPIDTGSVSGIALRGDQIWFVTDAGNVGWVPRTAPGSPPGATTIVLNLSTFGVQGLGQAIATNGREIFVGTSVSSGNTDPAQVWMFDPEDANPTLTPLFLLGGSAFALTPGRDGNVIAGRLGGQLWEIDPVAMTGTQVNALQSPQANTNGCAMNPWLNIIGSVAGFGSSARQIDFYDVAAGSWQFSPAAPQFGTPIPSGVASRHEPPFVVYGVGCPGTAGEPRIGWSGVPLQGQSFDVTVRNADGPSAILVLGLSNTTDPLIGGPLPFDLGAFAAPGCTAWTSTEEATLFQLVTASGEATQTLNVPTNAALAGLEVFAQWALSSNVNNLGLVFSDALHIRIR